MNKFCRKLVVRCCKLLHYLSSVAIFSVFWYCSPDALTASEGQLHILSYLAVYALTLLLLLRVYNAYDLMLSTSLGNIFSQSLSQVLAGAFLYVLLLIDTLRFINPLPLLILWAAQLGLNLIWNFVAGKVYRRLQGAQNTVVVYRDGADLARITEIYRHTHQFRITHHIENPRDDIHALLPMLEGFDAVFVVGVNATLRNGIAKYCAETGIDGYFAPHVGDILMSGAQYLQGFSVPITRVTRAAPTPEYVFFKRLLDIVLSLLGIVVLSPVMLLTALAIKLCDGGPVFYRQTRLTQNGKEFRIFKFRSMRRDAESDGIARLASTNDRRITPVGKFIRACRVDELPQLFNILSGDMTLVGPRPERPEIAREYEETLPAFSLRLQVKAGLTGFAQIYGRYNSDPYDKLQMDLMYISKMSPVLDLKLIFATIKVLFMKDSTSGIEEGQTTPMR